MPGLATYKKLVIADGRLTGAVLFGDTADGLWYLDLIRAGASIEAFRDDIMFGRALAERIQLPDHSHAEAAPAPGTELSARSGVAAPAIREWEDGLRQAC